MNLPPPIAPPPPASGPLVLAPPASDRAPGFDLARAVAVIGMLLMHTIGPVYPADGENQVLSASIGWFHGRAAATFVVLAGVGLGMQVRRSGVAAVSYTHLKPAT